MSALPISNLSLYRVLLKKYFSGRPLPEVRRIIFPLAPDGIFNAQGRVRSAFLPHLAKELSVACHQEVDLGQLVKTLEDNNLLSGTADREQIGDAGNIYRAMIRERDRYQRTMILLNHVNRFGFNPNENREIATNCLSETFLFRSTQVFTVDPKKETWLHRYSIGEDRPTLYGNPSVPLERSVDDFVAKLIRSKIPPERIALEKKRCLYQYEHRVDWSSLYIPDIERFKKSLEANSVYVPRSEKPEEVLYLTFGRPEDVYVNVYVASQQQIGETFTPGRKHFKTLLESFASFLSPARKLEYAHQQLQIFSVTDALTGLVNRKKLFEKIEDEFSRASRYERSFSLLIFDIDFFKRVNDTHGHQAGDYVIKTVAEVAKRASRTNDVVGRYGGEEYVIVAPETGENGAHVLAKRLRETIEKTKFVYDGTITIPLTISIGVVTYDPLKKHINNITEMIYYADQALLKAKREGRNRVIIADLPKPE
jgi:diguanylate cyclase (GGDEF)-like protein